MKKIEFLDLPKIESLGRGVGVPKTLLEKGDNPENGGLIYKWDGCHFFHYFAVQLHLLCVCVCVYVCVCVCEREGGRIKFPLLNFGSSVF